MRVLKDILKEKKISIYRLSKVSGVPYATCSDIVSGKADIEKCSVDTVYRLSHAMGVTMEEFIAPYLLMKRKEKRG